MLPATTVRKNRLALGAVACLSCILFSACAGVVQSDHASTPKRRIRTVLASIQNTDSWLGKWTPRALEGSESLIGIQFVDPDHAWVASSLGSLYRTSDQGMTWSKVRVPVPVNASLASFFFASPSSGWVVLQKYPPDVLEYQSNEYWIMHTPDDGENWDIQHNGHQAQVDQLRFAGNQEGWAAGRTFIKTDVLQSFPFVMHTSDQGKHWTNVSETLSPVSPGDEVTDLYILKESEAMLTTSGGKVFKTENAGLSWQELAALEDEPAQSYFGRLGQTSAGFPWLLGGSDSLEGMWGVLAKKEADGSWTKYTAGAYFRDAVFLSEKDVLVCGHTRQLDGSPHRESGRQGVILRSSDGGISWTTIYQSPGVPSINALTAVNSNTVWAVGEKGFLLRLEFPAD